MKRISESSITVKLLGINILILLAVIAIAGTNLFSSRQVENTLIPLINSDVKKIIQNSALSRELNTTFAELNLILNTFTKQHDVLDIKGSGLLDNLRKYSKLPGQADTVTESLTLFHDGLKRLFDKCRAISGILQSVDFTHKNFDKQLSALEASVTMMLVKGKSSEKEYSRYSVEQVSATIPDIRNMLLQIKLLLNQSTQLSSNSLQEGDEKLILSTLQDVHGNLQSVITAGEELVPLGNQLIALIQNYQKQIADYYEALRMFQQEFGKMNAAQTRVMSVMKDIDNKINASTGRIQSNISEKLTSARIFTFVLSIVIGVIVIFVGFFTFQMIRPLGELAKISAQLAKGKVDCTIREPRTHDEIGTLFHAFKQLVDTTKETTKVVEEIAAGNLTVEVKERSEEDRMMKAVNRMIRELNAIRHETDGMIKAVEEGKSDVLGNAEAFRGGWKELVTGVNSLIIGLRDAVGKAASISMEMELAKRIQMVLLPKKPVIQGYEIAASCEPADEVGGDYYDVISVGGYDWIVIGDVSGHGITAGLVMMMVQTAIHTVLIQNPKVPPSDMLWIINRTIYENIAKMDEQKHMTILVLAAGKDGFFDFSGLHEDILLWCADNEKVEKIATDGMWIGLEPDISKMLPMNEFRMETGDCIVLYTDGIIEAKSMEDGSFFGAERLEQIISSCGGCSAAEIHAAILEELESFEKPDDVTLFVMKRV